MSPEGKFRYVTRTALSIAAPLVATPFDDWFFGVSAIGPDGFETPAVFPGAAGTFKRGGVTK